LENLSSEVNFAITFFLIVSGVIIGLAGIFLIKIFMELSTLIGSFDKLVELVNYEFVPTIKEIQKTLKHVSSISDKADKHISQLSDSIDSASVSTSTAMQKAKVGFSSAVSGLAEGFKRLISQQKQTHK
jgi:predicted PurR-regulated permease PerM